MTAFVKKNASTYKDTDIRYKHMEYHSVMYYFLKKVYHYKNNIQCMCLLVMTINFKNHCSPSYTCIHATIYPLLYVKNKHILRYTLFSFKKNPISINSSYDTLT